MHNGVAHNPRQMIRVLAGLLQPFFSRHSLRGFIECGTVGFKHIGNLP
jgi:hypothetical protein